MRSLNAGAGIAMKQIREEKKMSKAELGRQMGIDGATVFRLENNLQKFDLVKIEKFCQVVRMNQLAFFRKAAKL